MGRKIENTYGRMIRGAMVVANPIKKFAVKTHCIVHKFINIQAVQILNNDGYNEVAEFFRKNIKALNEGVTWADQDFKSSNHFYHIKKEKGLYGFSNALNEALKYHNMAVNFLKEGKDMNKCMFYLGASCHLVQDATVPHHVNNKLLKKHRQFELWIIRRLFNDYSFAVEKDMIRYPNLEDYVKKNALVAFEAHDAYNDVEDVEERYYSISKKILNQAQRSTAGFLLDFYEEHIQNSEKNNSLN